MIQQITPIQSQPASQSQPVQAQQDPSQSFESVIRQAAGRRDGETKDNTSAPGRAKDDPAEKKQDSADTKGAAVLMLNASLPAALSLVPGVLTGETALPSVPTIAADTGASPSQQTVSALEVLSSPAASTVGKSAAPIQEKSSVPIPQAANVQTAAAPQKLGETVSTATPAQTNSVPAQQAALPSTDSSSVEVQQNTEAGRPVQKGEAAPQRISSMTEQSVSPAVVSRTPVSAQSGEKGSSDAASDSGAQQTSVFHTDEKSEPNSKLLPNGQVPSYREMVQTGNVVIKISGAVSDTAKPAVRQVADNVLSHVKSGDSHFEMELFPKNLGKVTVKLAAQNGMITVEIAAADPKTHNMLLSGAGEIRSMLESAVHQPVQVREAAQNMSWDQQQGGNPSHSGQEENRQDRQSPYHADRDDTDTGTEDFLAMLQQLRMKTIMG